MLTHNSESTLGMVGRLHNHNLTTHIFNQFTRYNREIFVNDYITKNMLITPSTFIDILSPNFGVSDLDISVNISIVPCHLPV